VIATGADGRSRRERVTLSGEAERELRMRLR
jgi:hypothetical protein